MPKIRKGERAKFPSCRKKGQDATRVQRLATRPGPKQYSRCKVCYLPDDFLRPFTFVAIETDRRPA